MMQENGAKSPPKEVVESHPHLIVNYVTSYIVLFRLSLYDIIDMF